MTCAAADRAVKWSLRDQTWQSGRPTARSGADLKAIERDNAVKLIPRLA
jgi:hypothetical protein